MNNTFKIIDVKTNRLEYIIKELNKSIHSKSSIIELMNFSTKLYEKGYNALDIITLLENNKYFTHLTIEKKYELLITFNKVRKEFRNEKLLILFLLNFIYLSSDFVLENISFM
jgi:hypothetical protein